MRRRAPLQTRESETKRSGGGNRREQDIAVETTLDRVISAAFGNEPGKDEVTMAFIVTRIQVGDYDVFKPMFDQDAPGARQSANGHRIFRGVEDPNEVIIQIEFASPDDAQAGRERLVASGVLDRFPDKTGPIVVQEVEAVRY